ncbi:MAG: alpha/beta hydrolase [Deltaproteobacteria bacterium]|nr:alpha/beta hydrolase [Deltaproteobacteria bacterium]
MKHDEGFFHAGDGTKLYRQTWFADTPKAAALFIHGYGDHSGRYEPLARKLTGMGVSVYALDYRGHGKSGGRRGAISSFEQYMDDVDQVRKRLVQAEEGKPWFIIGHSLGGLIALKFAIERPDGASGVVVSSPLLGLALDVPAIKAFAGRLLSGILPFVSLPTEIDPKDLSHDNQIVEAYIADPLVHKVANARWFTQTEKAQHIILQSAPNLEMPLLHMQAGGDKIVSVKTSREFFEKAGTADKVYKEYPGLYHELFNEIPSDRDQVFSDLADWLSGRI